MAKKRITEIITEITEEFLNMHNMELYHVEYVKEGKDWFLRVFIDRPVSDAEEEKYISTEDCELVSRFISEKLDETDPIDQNYYLEVSSPGMDRQLFEQKHFDRYKGSLVDVKLYKPYNGDKTAEGVLVGLIDGNVVIKDEEDNEIVFSPAQVVRVNLTVVF